MKTIMGVWELCPTGVQGRASVKGPVGDFGTICHVLLVNNADLCHISHGLLVIGQLFRAIGSNYRF